jgi:2-succinyl-5-enolpyruvyl-6-hydroxy-3-cyclohexene-1-carboxylate synthase
MNNQFPSITALWAELIVEELRRCGVKGFSMSPGSRCTPLTLAAASRDTGNTVHYDERGAAYYALGYVRATGQPAALVCTSGTAVANYLPAVVEASMDRLPLIVLSADRPFELRQSGANQTIDQVKIFGDFVRFHCDLPCPSEEVAPQVVLTTVDQTVYRATRPPAGPVHLNCMFREPLAPPEKRQDFSTYLSGIKLWLESDATYTTYGQSRATLDDEQLRRMDTFFNDEESGLLVVGRLARDSERDAVVRLARRLGWPVMPDISSGLRLGMEHDNFVPYHDLLLLSESVWEALPRSVVHMGGQVISKRLARFLAEAPLENYIRVADHPFRHDPAHRVTVRIESDLVDFCDSVRAMLVKPHAGDLPTLRKQATAVGWVIDDVVFSEPLNEPGVARLVSRHIGAGSGLFLASSLPVREMDWFADPSGPAVPIGCNRGASGIDGTIASAVGFARGTNRPVTLLVGDLAMLHDLNSLALVKKSPEPVITIVLNNNGGGLFSFLPIAEKGEHFEALFAAPHGLSFEGAAKMFGLAYHRPVTEKEFVSVYRAAQRENLPAIIEITTDRKHNFDLHQKIFDRVVSALGGSRR